MHILIIMSSARQEVVKIIIITIPRTIFIVLSSWLRAIPRIHSVHLMNADLAPGMAANTQTEPTASVVSPPAG